MVTTRCIGRMGNNLFQLAAMIGYARKHGINYCIPKATVAPSIWPNWFEHLSNCTGTHLRSPVFIKEAEHFYQELAAPVDNFDYIMEGYWQSYKYFDFCIDEIREVFNFNHDPIDACAVHVRRGDYVTEFPDKHPSVTAQYLNDAIDLNRKLTGNYHFMFFSDDIAWCRMYVEKNKKFLHCVFIEDNPAIDDLQLMLRCKHQIISNSSFSWWAAYLNDNPDKVVITPDEDNWFGPGNKHLDVKDLIPQNWNRIKY